MLSWRAAAGMPRMHRAGAWRPRAACLSEPTTAEDVMMNNRALDLSTEQSLAWQEKARRLHQLHEAADVLVLPNAWDRLSARLLANLPECHALGTTSAGIAAALGYPDGQRAPLDEMLAVARQIVAAVALPVTVDFEGGYADSPAQLAENIRQV